MAHSVLVVEDDRGVRELVRRYLERDRYSVVATGSGAQAIDCLEQGHTDAVIVDLGLPDIPGEEVLRVALDLGIPVVVLSSQGEVEQRIHGLELGAADYVGKPFSPRELVLRVGSVLAQRGEGTRPSEQSYGGGRLVVHSSEHQVTLDGVAVDVTPTEWTLLLAFASNPRRVFSRAELAGRIHTYDAAGYTRTIDSHIKNLRHKLGESGTDAHIIQTVPGVGYRCGWAEDA